MNAYEIEVQLTKNGPVYYVKDRWGMVATVTNDKAAAIAKLEEKNNAL